MHPRIHCNNDLYHFFFLTPTALKDKFDRIMSFVLGEYLPFNVNFDVFNNQQMMSNFSGCWTDGKCFLRPCAMLDILLSVNVVL